jgi:hypothetical protein
VSERDLAEQLDLDRVVHCPDPVFGQITRELQDPCLTRLFERTETFEDLVRR